MLGKGREAFLELIIIPHVAISVAYSFTVSFIVSEMLRLWTTLKLDVRPTFPSTRQFIDLTQVGPHQRHRYINNYTLKKISIP